MNESRKWAAIARPALLVGMSSMAASVTHCDYTDYPLKPSFCDEWCRVLLRANCDQEPENCVRVCEQSVAPAECLERQTTLLRCYDATPPSEFVCSGQGFQQIARPEERVCQPERDALIDCAYPDVKLCLDICRAAEAGHLDAGTDAEPPPGRVCPSHDIPCDSLCWTAQRELAERRDDAGLDAGSGPDSGGGFAKLADAIMACAIRRAEACRAGEPADAGAVNWSSALLQCAEELGF